MSPSRPRGCVQANYQQLISNLQFTHCIMHKLHNFSKKVLWQRLWLDLCTKQVVSVRACANQFLPCSSSGIALFGMRTVQEDSCLNSEQNGTLFKRVGGQEGGLGGGGGHFGPKVSCCNMDHSMCLYVWGSSHSLLDMVQ